MKDAGLAGRDEESDKISSIKEFVKTLEEAPTSLTDLERKLGEKYLSSRAKVAKLADRLKDLERALADTKVELNQEMGKGVGILEAVLALKD